MLSTFLYKKDRTLKTDLNRKEMFEAINDPESFLWVDLQAATEFESECLVEIFNFHDLAVEDCITDLSQPKADDYGDYLFLVMHALDLKGEGEIASVELDIFLGKNYVVTFHREPIKTVEQVRDNVSKRPDSYMGYGPDLLVYSLIDQLVDSYQPAVEHYESKVDCLEEEIFNTPGKDYLTAIIQAKRDIFHFRRTIYPQRETLNNLTRTSNQFIKADHRMYFRDVYDHLFRIYGTIDGLHEALNGILQAYFSYSSNKLNEIMKRMTVLATLSMPSVMIASIYGMNFHNMPELSHPYGYFGALGIMGVTSIGMLIWMKFKKWI